MLTELKALVHLLLWLFCFLVWKSTTHHQIIGIFFFDNVPSQYLSWHWLKYLLPHDISEPIDFTTLCQPSSHLPAYIHYLLTFLKWVATFNSQCRVFRLLHTSSGTANSSKRKWLLTTKHVSKLTHSLKLHYNTIILLLTPKLHHRPVTDPLYGLPDAPLHPDLGEAVRNALPWGSVSDSRTPSTCGQEVVGFKLPTL